MSLDMWKVDQLPAEKRAKYDQFVTMMLTLSANHARTKQLARQIFELGWNSGWEKCEDTLCKDGPPQPEQP